MGRPRIHDENTAAALLDSAERLLHAGGAAALSLREVAAGAGTSVQAVYSLFGSKEGLLGALGARAMELLHAGVDAVPVTDDPREDLVEAALVFRRFALDHPALFEVAFQRADPAVSPRFRATASDALRALARRFDRLHDAGPLPDRPTGSERPGRPDRPDRPTPQAVLTFHSLCEGMAGVELRGNVPASVDRERWWREAFRALLTGFGGGLAEATPATASREPLHRQVYPPDPPPGG